MKKDKIDTSALKWQIVGLFLTILLIPIVLNGCTYGHSIRFGSEVYAPTKEATVEFLYQRPNRPYKVIGIVSASGAALASSESVVRKLKGAAAKLGADAVILTEAGSAPTAVMPGQSYSSGQVYSNGYYSGSTSYTPPTVLYGAVVKGIAIKYVEVAKGGAK